MPRISIVIPCTQTAGCFETTLASVLQNRPPECEIVVVQPRRYDDPYELTGEVQFLEAPPESTLIDLVNAGVEAAQGELVHVLTCHVEVLEGWTQPLLRHFHDPTVAAVSPLVVDKATMAQVVSRGVHYGSGGARLVRYDRARRRTRRQHVVSPTLAAGVYRRQALLDVGGFSNQIAADYADVDLGLMLQAAGYQCVHEESSVVTTEHTRQAPCLSIASGVAAESLFWRNTEAASWSRIFLAHPMAWLAECICNLHRPALIPQLMGRGRAWLERATHREHQQHLQMLQERDAQQQLLPLDASAPARGDTSHRSRAAA